MIIRTVTGTLIALLLWIALMATLMRFSNAAPAALVLLPDDEFFRHMPPAVILAHNRYSITLNSQSPQFTALLYQAGARLVLPAGLKGCFQLPSA